MSGVDARTEGQSPPPSPARMGGSGADRGWGDDAGKGVGGIGKTPAGKAVKEKRTNCSGVGVFIEECVVSARLII